MPSAPTRVAETRDATAPGADDKSVEQGRPFGMTPRTWLTVVGMFVVLGVPLVVAAAALRRPHWYPVLDLAMTELRLRDVGTGQTPLIGLPGRIGPLVEQGSHPGPLGFYLLAVLYRLFGSSAWAMQASTIVLDLLALATALLIAARRGGTRLVVAVAALLGLLVWGYGMSTLTQPWNPYLPLLWWVVLLLAVWSVACDDVAMLPVAVFAGSLAAQTHVPYLGLALGVGAVAAVSAARLWRRAAPGSDDRRRVTRWGAAAVVLGVLIWTPPLVDQVVNEPGNLNKLYDHLATPPEDPVGLERGAELALAHLNLPQLLSGDKAATGWLVDASSHPAASLVPGLTLLAVWGLAVVTARRLGHTVLVRLHLVVGVALVVGAWSISRIFDKVWYYLTLWAWAVTGLLLLAIGWTVLVAIGSRLSSAGRQRLAGVVTGGLCVTTVLASAFSTADGLGVDPPEPHTSSTLGRVLAPTIAALETGEGAASGREGRYLVTWNDAVYFGSQAYGLVSELERAGFDAGLAPYWQVPITRHRVVDPADATAEVVLVTGVFVERWRNVPGVVEVAHVEPRSVSERAEFTRLRSAVIADLRADGLDDIVSRVDVNLFGASIDQRISSRAERWMARMLVLGEPTAVFVAPPGVAP